VVEPIKKKKRVLPKERLTGKEEGGSAGLSEDWRWDEWGGSRKGKLKGNVNWTKTTPTGSKSQQGNL